MQAQKDFFIGFGLTIGHDRFAKIVTPKVNTLPPSRHTYSESVMRKINEDPLYHGFPSSFDADILSNPVVFRPDGRVEYLVAGHINGKEGVFHITVRSDTIIHRLFDPIDDWVRYSNIYQLPKFSKISKLQ